MTPKFLLQIDFSAIGHGAAHFCIFIDNRGRHRKGVAIYNAVKVNLQQNLGFIEQK
jgi:hypothetical protein